MSCGVITIPSLSPPRSIFEAERHVARARCTTRTRISACNNARDRNGPAIAHQINQQRLAFGPTIYRFAAAVRHFLSGQLKIGSGVKDAFQADVARWGFRVCVKIASLPPRGPSRGSREFLKPHESNIWTNGFKMHSNCWFKDAVRLFVVRHINRAIAFSMRRRRQ
jgi:hypothetical protein